MHLAGQLQHGLRQYAANGRLADEKVLPPPRRIAHRATPTACAEVSAAKRKSE
jgi:hypothetical protein